MTIDDLVEELLDIKKITGNIDVVRPYTVCGIECHSVQRTPVVTVDKYGGKVVEL